VPRRFPEGVGGVISRRRLHESKGLLAK
jgi:hypothetical protein